MRKLGLFCWLLLLIGCIPNKKLVYLQDQYFGEEEYPVGTSIDSFEVPDFEYYLQVGDIISVKITSLTNPEYNIFKESESLTASTDPRLSGFIVEESGAIRLPDGGKVHLLGSTISQAESKIAEYVAQFLNSPTVVVKLLNFQFTILGEVNTPGRYTTYNTKINMLEAIGMAGDMTDFAERSRVKLVRYKAGKGDVVYLDLLRNDFLTSPYFYVQPNDFIYIPPLKAKTTRQYQLTNFTIILSVITTLTLLVTRL